METVVKKNEMLQVINKSGLKKTESQFLLERFQGFFDQASVWEAKAKALVVTDASQKKEMKEAREGRLALKSIRVETEKTRKSLKENIVKQGKAIDGVAKVIKSLIEPIEQHLDEQEKFVERQEQKRIEDLRAERAEALAPYGPEFNGAIRLGELSEEDFNTLFESVKGGFLAKQQAEQERIEQEKAEAEERERLRQENEKLRLQVEATKREIEAREAAKIAEQEKLDEEEWLASLQPESEKIISLAETIEAIEMPDVSGEQAQKIINDAEVLLMKVSKFLRTKAETL